MIWSHTIILVLHKIISWPVSCICRYSLFAHAVFILIQSPWIKSLSQILQKKLKATSLSLQRFTVYSVLKRRPQICMAFVPFKSNLSWILTCRALVQFPSLSPAFAYLETSPILLFSGRYWIPTPWNAGELLVKHIQGLSIKIMHNLALPF